MYKPSDDPDPVLETALELLEAHGREFWMLVNGNSMLPLVCEGDRIQVQILQSPPVRGEILVFRNANGLVAHRLLRLSYNQEGETICLTQGDHALTQDPPITLQHAAGRAVILHRGGRVIQLQSPAWRRVGIAVSAFQLVAHNAGSGSRLRRMLKACLELSLRAYLKLSAL